MMHNTTKAKKFLRLLSKHSNNLINHLVEDNAYKTFHEVDPQIKREDLRPSKEEQNYNSIKEEIMRLETKLQNLKNKRDDSAVKTLQRKIERLKGKIKRLEKPKDL